MPTKEISAWFQTCFVDSPGQVSADPLRVLGANRENSAWKIRKGQTGICRVVGSRLVAGEPLKGRFHRFSSWQSTCLGSAGSRNSPGRATPVHQGSTAGFLTSPIERLLSPDLRLQTHVSRSLNRNRFVTGTVRVRFVLANS